MILAAQKFSQTRSRASVNANQQRGPEAAYCYRSAGSGTKNYTITLTIKGKNGRAFTTATVTQSVAVTAFSSLNGYTEVYCDSNATPGGNGTIGKPFNTIQRTWAARAAVHLKRVRFWKLEELELASERHLAFSVWMLMAQTQPII